MHSWHYSWLAQEILQALKAEGFEVERDRRSSASTRPKLAAEPMNVSPPRRRSRDATARMVPPLPDTGWERSESSLVLRPDAGKLGNGHADICAEFAGDQSLPGQADRVAPGLYLIHLNDARRARAW